MSKKPIISPQTSELRSEPTASIDTHNMSPTTKLTHSRDYLPPHLQPKSSAVTNSSVENTSPDVLSPKNAPDQTSDHQTSTPHPEPQLMPTRSTDSDNTPRIFSGNDPVQMLPGNGNGYAKEMNPNPIPVTPITPLPKKSPNSPTFPLASVNTTNASPTTSTLVILPGFIVKPNMPMLATSKIEHLYYHKGILVNFQKYVQARFYRDLRALDSYHEPVIDEEYANNNDVCNALCNINLHDFINNCTPLINSS
mmetsp:Transcript_53796/g.64912  ORF Transcript_53796/g.64912 Transcript_53796/m.64912 type:complete len:252 (+) Transcript_53796:527-1282(+)|eukprot:CAMPEP_0172500806 /NCGR_PEP_ID=MMETSP1066-20121228/143212_1 /TAXON_ID=671091 /ORGANISM="Coscinodiscus wailesii, Strain CCMP2513" /LENGTH=251 /DNA_ID=CAMNT_0013275251 /DNA_START=527 /DNA_END=1282 /DNA_ORIENTATION=-